MGTVRELNGHPAGSLIVTLGLIAHDAVKDELCLFARANRDLIRHLRIVAPEDTARALEEIGLEVQSLAPDMRGGDIALAAAVLDGRVDAVVFLRDPIVVLAGEPGIEPLLKVCDLEKVPLATNLGSAEIFLHFLTDARKHARPPHEPFEVFRAGQVLRLSRDPARGRNGRGKVKP